VTVSVGAGFCTACGGADGPHPACEAVLSLEPPRFCALCGRRMVVQVRPDGWWSRCSRHGVTDSTDVGAGR
jgi:hypothetical protein